ncbi:pre-mRNA-processing protein 45 [Monosporozyma unispora]|nr:mRNA splicing protein [Kazachstania unispora]
MSFSSLLPPPKHGAQQKDKLHERSRLIVKALTDEDDESDQPEGDELTESFNNIASRVQLNDFIPLRQRNINLEVPYPSQEEINKCYSKTFAHFQKLLAKSNKNYVEDNKDETITMSDGRRILVVTKTSDPLQPKMTKSAKKIYVPSNEEEGVQPQLHVSSNSTGQTVTPQMKKDWQIPTFVSQWKNPKGYAISSRGDNGVNGESQEINEGFIDLANALEEADKEARLKLQIKKEAEVIELNKAMRERELKLNKIAKEVRANRPYLHPQRAAAQSRRFLQGRDISDKVNPYQHEAKKRKPNVVTYDSRLYAKGASSGKNRSENVYDNPLFAQQDIDSIYRVKVNKNKNGNDDGENIMSNGPIEFTKAEQK